MSGYVAFIALLNLALGYGMAVYVRRRERPTFRQFLADLMTLAPGEPAARHDAEGRLPQVAEDEVVRSPDGETAEPIAEEAGATPAAPSDELISDLAAELVTRSEVDELLVELTSVSDPLQNPAAAVLIELDPIETNDDLDADRLLAGIANTVSELLDEAHTAARFGQQQLLLLLPGDNESAATQRTERVRQRIEATEFLIDKQPVAATVSCAMGQLSSDYVPADVVAALQRTLDEAKRKGGNRTYLYDGASPAPVVPPELNLAPQTCAI
jgi:diguanylate cyclase (GGDEF)-like protein